MANYNKIIIIGHLGKDPELRYTPAGDAVCEFSLATSVKKKDRQGEQQEVTTWYKVTFWRKLAEVCGQYLAKGDPVYVEGELSTEEWTDRDGNTRTSLIVQGSTMHLIKQRSGE